MTNGYQKSVQSLIKKIQIIAFIIAGVIVVVVVYTSISKWKISEEEELTPPVSEKIVFKPPLKLKDTIEGIPYEYSFCRPESARSGATCGGLAGATTNPYGGKPPYSFSHQFGVGFIPTGLALELNGLLRGTPTLPGNYTFGICVTDLHEEVCKSTSLTVKPKSEQLEEAMEKATVTIESASCVKTLDVGIEKYEDLYWLPNNVYEMRVSGTVTGPPGAKLFVNTNPMSSAWKYTFSCTAWEPSAEQECARGSGPSNSSWSLVVSDIDELSIVDLKYFNYAINVEAYVNSIATARRVPCPVIIEE